MIWGREINREKGKERKEKGEMKKVELHRPTEGIVCGPSKDLELGLERGTRATSTQHYTTQHEANKIREDKTKQDKT